MIGAENAAHWFVFSGTALLYTYIVAEVNRYRIMTALIGGAAMAFLAALFPATAVAIPRLAVQGLVSGLLYGGVQWKLFQKPVFESAVSGIFFGTWLTLLTLFR